MTGRDFQFFTRIWPEKFFLFVFGFLQCIYDYRIIIIITHNNDTWIRKTTSQSLIDSVETFSVEVGATILFPFPRSWPRRGGGYDYGVPVYGLHCNYLTAVAICVLFYRMYIILYCRQKPSRWSLLLLLPTVGRVVRSNAVVVPTTKWFNSYNNNIIRVIIIIIIIIIVPTTEYVITLQFTYGDDDDDARGNSDVVLYVRHHELWSVFRPLVRVVSTVYAEGRWNRVEKKDYIGTVRQ
jgi:hypothetical protein